MRGYGHERKQGGRRYVYLFVYYVAIRELRSFDSLRLCGSPCDDANFSQGCCRDSVQWQRQSPGEQGFPR